MLEDNQLLSREEFKRKVFERDHFQCVHCQEPAVDAHHLLDRSLWADSGYYLNNGVSLCALDHLNAEKTLLECSELRKEAGIKEVLLPPQLDESESYDKWGNIIKLDGTKYPGELFWRGNVQNILKETGQLGNFVMRIKYPRTSHLPWSLGRSSNDNVLESDNFFEGKKVVVTEKLDGENTTMSREYIHSRSLDSRNHPSRDWVKSLWGDIRWEIPQGWRFCGENLYALHSIPYENLDSYFYLLSVWDDGNSALPWLETKEWAQLLGLQLPPVLFEGAYDKEKIEKLWSPLDADHKEGYVIRTQEGFAYRDFQSHVAKFVRPNHVETNEHWMTGAIIKNKLKTQIHTVEDL